MHSGALINSTTDTFKKI